MVCSKVAGVALMKQATHRNIHGQSAGLSGAG
jgi:hypothetical protein